MALPFVFKNFLISTGWNSSSKRYICLRFLVNATTVRETQILILISYLTSSGVLYIKWYIKALIHSICQLHGLHPLCNFIEQKKSSLSRVIINFWGFRPINHSSRSTWRFLFPFIFNRLHRVTRHLSSIGHSSLWTAVFWLLCEHFHYFFNILTFRHAHYLFSFLPIANQLLS